MTKISAKKHKKCIFRLDADLGQVVWESVSSSSLGSGVVGGMGVGGMAVGGGGGGGGRAGRRKIIPIESIKEIRTGKDARYFRESFQMSQEYEDRWLTIIYLLPSAPLSPWKVFNSGDVGPAGVATTKGTGGGTAGAYWKSAEYYKMVHVIVATKDVCRVWEECLRRVCEMRRELMTGLGRLEAREKVWE